MKKNFDNICSTCTACMSSGKNLKYQVPSTDKIKLPIFTKMVKETQTDFSGNSATH